MRRVRGAFLFFNSDAPDFFIGAAITLRETIKFNSYIYKMNIPDKIIESLDHLPVDIRGQVYVATIEYMRSGKEIEGLDGIAKGVFILVKRILDNILNRRRIQAAYRQRKRQAGRPTPVPADEPTAETPLQTPERPLTRQQRRALEREKQKITRRERA